MNPGIIHPHVITGYLTSIVTLAIGIFVFFKNTRSSTHRSFLILTLSISQWSFFIALQSMQTQHSWALIWGRFSNIGAMLIPVLFYYFSLKITGHRRIWNLTIGFSIATILILFTLFTPHMFPSARTDVGPNFLAQAGKFYFLNIIFFMTYVLMAIFHLGKEVRKSVGSRKKHIQIFFWASVIGFTIGFFNFFPLYGITIPPYPYSAACGAIYAGVIAYAILKHKLFDIELIIKKGLLFAVLFLIVYLTVSLIIFGISLPFTKAPISILSGLSIALAMLIYEPLKSFLTTITNRFLFQKKTDYTILIHRLTEKLSQIKDELSLAGEIIDFLTQEMGIEWAKFINVSEMNNENPLIQFMSDKLNPFVVSPFDTETSLPLEIKEIVREQKIEALVPIYVERNLYGILLLGKKKSDNDMNQEDEALLKALMDEVGMFFLSAKLLKESTRTGLELGQKIKMASVKKLARGVHHEVRNPLHAMDLTAETILENLREKRYQNVSIQEFAFEIKNRSTDMLRNVERIKNSLNRFAQFARPEEDFELKTVSFKDELDKFLTLMQEGQRLDKIRIHNRVKDSRIQASEGMLQEIFFNLFTNAYEAMDGKGELFLSTEANDEFITFRIKDTGPGISKDVISHIFEPYFTTKQDSEAVGIGLSISKHHMTRLNGSIETSEINSGAEFVLKFKKAL